MSPTTTVPESPGKLLQIPISTPAPELLSQNPSDQNDHKGYFGDDGSVLKLDCGDGGATL